MRRTHVHCTYTYIHVRTCTLGQGYIYHLLCHIVHTPMYMYECIPPCQYQFFIQFFLTPIFTVHIVLGVVVKSTGSPMEYVVCMYVFSCTCTCVLVHVYYMCACSFPYGVACLHVIESVKVALV